MFEMDKVPHRPLLRLKVTGLVHADDYVDSVPKLKGLIAEHDPVGLLCDWTELMGWDEEAESIRFFLRLELRSEFERIAILAESNWDHEVNRLHEVTVVPVQRYPAMDSEAAMAWLESGTES